MTGKEYAALRASLLRIIESIQNEMARARECVTVPPPHRLRQARPEDVKPGAVIYYRVEEAELHWQIVAEVINPDDDFKAYYAEDGNRYGLSHAWVEQG